MTVTMTRSAGTRVARHPVRRFDWPATLALHLLPAAAMFAFEAALRALGLSPQFALTLAFAFVLTPIQLGLLLHAAHRATGRWSLLALPSVLSFQRRLPPRLYLMLLPSLAAIALGVAMLLDPDLVPEGSGAGVLAATLAVNGLLRPVVQEVYFRAYLLPRLPVGGGLAVVTSAALSTVQYAGHPQLLVFMLVVQLILTAVTVRLDSVRVSVAAHCLIGAAAPLAALL
ncbi:CPBP family intramembrane glutamic endopeptidase [Dactylosporangium sp. NPDC049525]|uniref:CPBP family intramembrane glutamic endopeptidase n=1 Tax=Dactylosporangium sp. NPDC049525 TaxID=3154730 RepID=UPI00342726CB